MELYDLKPYLHITLDDFEYDAVLTALYESSKQTFTTMTNLDLTNTANYEFTYYGIKSTNRLYFDMFPVNSIVSVQYRDLFLDALSTLASTEYELHDNVLYLKSSQTRDKLVVTADVGYSTIPDAIDFLLVQIVNYYFTYQANKVYLSSEGKVPLMPDESTLPKHLYDQIKGYKIGL